MRYIILSLLATTLVFTACKSRKDSSQPEANATQPPTQQTTPPATMEPARETIPNDANPQKEGEENMYRLIVSFISIGEGIDRNARVSMDKALNSMQDKTGKNIAVESYSWGREGENDFCFKLNELTSEEQVIAVNEVKEVFKGNNLVQISENQPCRHKR